jgi:hypothetical protein
LGVSRQGEFRKQHANVFAKDRCRKKIEGESGGNPMSVSPWVFGFIAFWGVSQREQVENAIKNK